MSARIDPPLDSEELAKYFAGDLVYYFRGSAGKWRLGEIIGPGGSSGGSPVYLIKDLEKEDERLIEDSNIRKQTKP